MFSLPVSALVTGVLDLLVKLKYSKPKPTKPSAIFSPFFNLLSEFCISKYMPIRLHKVGQIVVY